MYKSSICTLLKLFYQSFISTIGPNLYAAGNTYKVIIEKKNIIHVPSFLDGLLITFLSYYVFGFAYPKEIEGTLEAIQRWVFKLYTFQLGIS